MVRNSVARLASSATSQLRALSRIWLSDAGGCGVVPVTGRSGGGGGRSGGEGGRRRGRCPHLLRRTGLGATSDCRCRPPSRGLPALQMSTRTPILDISGGNSFKPRPVADRPGVATGLLAATREAGRDRTGAVAADGGGGAAGRGWRADGPL